MGYNRTGLLPTTDLEMMQLQQEALAKGPLAIQLAIAQPSKDLARLADRAYRDKTGIAKELIQLWEIDEVPLIAGMSDPRNETILFAAWARWWACRGYNMFRIDEGLFAKLALTDPPDMPIEELLPPYEAFRIEVPEGFLPIASAEKNMRWVRWIDVIRLPDRVGETTADIAAANPATAIWNSISVADEALAPGVAVKARWAVWGRSTNRDVPGSLTTFQPTTGTTVPLFVTGMGETLADAFDLEVEQAAMRSCVRVLVNLCLALDSRALQPQHKAVATHQPSRGPVPRPNIICFDRSVVDMHVIEAAKAIGHGKAAHVGWKVKSRFIVRGHWRNQACGLGMQDRKRIWVDPYWKGDDTAAGYAHLYNGKGV